MDNSAVIISFGNFLLIYILIIIVAIILKICKIHQTKLLIIASVRMTLQLTLAGFILMYIFENPSPLFVILYLASMSSFAIFRILSANKTLNLRFKIIIGLSITVMSLLIVTFFIGIVIKQNIFNPQYIIPISGMIMGNAMTGIMLGLRTFMSSIKAESLQINTLLNMSASPKAILLPFVNKAIETALLPTLNSMLGMGIVSLPGMMTGQILQGSLPTTAIVYQISVLICITTVVTSSVFLSLYLGFRTLYNDKNQFIY